MTWTGHVDAQELLWTGKTAERRTARLRANDNAISAWAIIGNFTFELIVHIKWMINKTYCAVIVQGALIYVILLRALILKQVRY